MSGRTTIADRRGAQWVEDKRHHGTDRPNWQRIQTEAWQYAVRCVPITRGR